MTLENTPESLTEEARKEVFHALVAAQDEGLSVEASRAQLAEQFNVSLEEVREIEREGIARQWPPLA